jgi:hypothetical protein
MATQSNIAASVRDRLRNQTRNQGGDLQTLLHEFVLGRFFARLSQSAYHDRLILKGAQLFRLWSDQPHRPTRDADFLGYGDPDPEKLAEIFDQITATQPGDDDGLKFEPATAEPIRDDNIYGGIRLKIIALLGTMRIPLQFDVGYGDVITPATEQRTWRGMLGYPDIPLMTYPVETVIAEKLEAMVSLDITNSRMKDFYDLHWLATYFELDPPSVRKAIEVTFARRQTELPQSPPVAYTTAFMEDSQKREQWNAFLRKNKLQAPELPELIKIIQTRFPFPF